jgi:hypothetical protein
MWQAYSSPASPTTNRPDWLYVNSDGTFRLDGATGVAEYVWPPCAFDDGTMRDNSNLKSYRDDLDFVSWASISTPGEQDEGWIFKSRDSNFWYLFGDAVFTINGQKLHRLYYSDNGQLFLRWRTVYGTRRSKPAPNTSDPISTPPGDVSQPIGGQPTTIKIDLGKHKKPIPGLRIPCPTLKHGLGCTRDEWVKVWIEVSHPNINAIISDVKDCALTAAAIAITAAIVTEGAALAAAEVAFMASFKPCVQLKIGGAASQLQASFKVDTESGKWRGH